MAENVQMKLPYVLRRNTSSNPRMSGKYYGRVWEKNLLDTRGLADHMVEHGIVRNNSKVYTILSKLQECIPELLSQGVGVKLAGKHITGIHIRIRPWSEKVGNLTSKALLSQCELEYVGEVETITVDGKKKIVLHRPQPEEGGEG